MITRLPFQSDTDVFVDARPWRIDITAADAFGTAADPACERFLRRAFMLEAVQAIRVDRIRGNVTIRHRAGPASLPAFLTALSKAVVGADPAQADGLPMQITEDRFVLFRHGPWITPWDIQADRPGVLELRRMALLEHPSRRRRLITALESTPGITTVRSYRPGARIVIQYDPGRWNTDSLLRMADRLYEGSRAWVDPPEIEPTPYGLAHVTVGVATGAMFIPEFAIASAVLLVGMNGRTLREARDEVGRRRLGLATLYSTIVVTTLATGQFLAAALMTWFFRFWNRRFEDRLQQTRLGMLVDHLPRPILARRLLQGGLVAPVPPERLGVGDLFTLSPGEIAPADATLVAGEVAVDESTLTGQPGVAHKQPGDGILAGSVLVAGRLTARVERAGPATRAAAMSRALLDATRPVSGTRAPTHKAETFANQAVPPTLVLAGLGGLAVGDLLAVGAILRPDYATGVGISGPLDAWGEVAACLRDGALIHAPDVLDRLTAIRVVVLDDCAAVNASGLDLGQIDTTAEPDVLLALAAGALRHRADQRAGVLQRACRDLGLEPLDVHPLEWDARGVTAEHRGHRIWVGDTEDISSDIAWLGITVDGIPAGRLDFVETGRPFVLAALDALRHAEPGLHFTLVSSRPRSTAAMLAERLGIAAMEGGLDAMGKAAFIRRCRERIGPVAFVGDCRSGAAAVADLTIDVGEDLHPAADIHLLSPGLTPLADLWRVARGHVERGRADRFGILAPNLLCVAGALTLGLTSLHAVVISNLGTLGLYASATARLNRRRAPGTYRVAGSNQEERIG